MNQRVKRAIATAMSLTMVATATPVSPLYNAIQNAVSSVMMQASATSGEDIFADYANKEKFSLSSIDDLNAFAEAVNTEGKDFSGKKVYLTADIEGFQTPIGTSTAKFKGTFDGNNKTIKLNINQTTDYAGLFGFVQGATIKNVKVTGSVSGEHYIGGVCGSAENLSVIDNCTNDSELKVYGTYNIGGIAGRLFNATVVNCTNRTEQINHCSNYGGVVGYTKDCDEKNFVSNCMNIVTDKDCGLVGLPNSATISNCFTTSTQFSNFSSESVTFTNCYYDSGDSDKTEVNGIQGLMHNKCIGNAEDSVTALLNADIEAHNIDAVITGGIIWNGWVAADTEIPSLNPIPGYEAFAEYSTSDKFYITTIDELNVLAKLVNNGVNFTGKTVFLDADIEEEFTTPIGNSSTKTFKGTFDGKGHKVKLNINLTTDYAGLFGCVEGATIRNVTVEGAVTGKSFVGSICAQVSSNSNVYNCTNNAEITGTEGMAGGICGEVRSNCNIYNCTNNKKVNGGTIRYNTGGICGELNSDCNVYNCVNNAEISGNNDVGGICGNAYSNSNVYNCINTNNTVTGTSYVGGICGTIYRSEVDKCFSVDTDEKEDSEGTGVTEITAEQLAGTDKVSDNKTVTELLNEYVSSYEGDLELYSWKQNGTPKLQAPLEYNKIEGKNLKWAIDEDTLIIKLDEESRTGEQYTEENAMPDWSNDSPWYNNTEITSVQIKDGVTSIGSHAFDRCSNLTSITIPSGVTSIGSHAFDRCSNLTSITIPSGVTSIGNDAFNGCSNLTSITIPSSVTSIGDYVFFYCESLESITIPSSVTSIGDGAFADCSNLTSITIPSGVTTINDNAFEDCSNLTSITIPSGVTTINNSAFYNCKSLESITIPSSVTEIGSNAFNNCESLESITIPSGVTKIESSTFKYCESLKSITIPSGVTTIKDSAFNGCESLESITIPSSVTRLYEDTFRDCNGLTSIRFEGDVPDMGDKYDAFTNVGTTTPAILYYPKDNATWEDLLKDKSEIFEWKGGKFTAEPYLNWNDIADTALRWAISANGTLYIDKQENPSSENYTIPAYDDVPWKDSINKIRFVDISSSVMGVNATSFTDFTGQAILVLENESTLTPTAVEGSNYDSLGGGEFIYNTQLIGSSLSLAGKIGVNISFYVNKDEGSTITINNEEIKLEDCTSKNNIYTYTLWVAPKDAYNDIIFKTEKEGLIIVNQTFNVKSNYVDAVFKDDEHETYSEDVYNMVRALDVYINSSRIYFNEVDEADAATIKASITSALENLDTNGLDEYAPDIASGSVEGIKYYGSSLILNSGVKLRHYITIADEADIENIKIMVGDTTYGSEKLKKTKVNGTDVYYFETDEFNPKYFNTNVSVLYDEEDISEAISVIDNYSVLSFINLALDSSTKDTDLGTICKSIYSYYLAADNYNKN